MTKTKQAGKTGAAKKAVTGGAGRAESLEGIYFAIEGLLREHAPPFRTDLQYKTGTKKALHLAVPRPVVIPGAYGGKPVDLMLASVILQKGFVGFYMMCIYMNKGMKEKLPPRLAKALKGKSCFQIKEWDEGLKHDVAAALEMGRKFYRERGWV